MIQIQSHMNFLLLDRDLFFTIVKPKRNEAIPGYNRHYSFGTKDDYQYGTDCGFSIGIEDEDDAVVVLDTYSYGGMKGFAFSEADINQTHNKKEREMMKTCIALIKQLSEEEAMIEVSYNE